MTTREQFRVVYRQAIEVQMEREAALDAGDRDTAEELRMRRDGMIREMVDIATNADDPLDRRYLASYNTFRKSWEMVFANAGGWRSFVKVGPK